MTTKPMKREHEEFVKKERVKLSFLEGFGAGVSVGVLVTAIIALLLK